MLCFVQATKRWKEVTLYPGDPLHRKLERKKGQDKKQDKSLEGANLNTIFSFLYAQMSAQDSRISVLSPPRPHIRITDFASPGWAPAEPSQLLLRSSPGATRKDTNRKTPYDFLDALLFQLSSALCNSVFYWFIVVLIFLYFSPFYFI